MSNNRISSRRRAPRSVPSSYSRSKPTQILARCSSEPILTVQSVDENGDAGIGLVRLRTCMDVFPSPLRSLPRSPLQHEKYGEDSKVVVSVTVEGSPGAVRTMVRLGTSVEETVKMVVDRYREEGRSPRLDLDGTHSFQLHYSYFSLQGIRMTDKIGGLGSRSFYLRKRRPEDISVSVGEEEHVNSWSATTVVPPPLIATFIAKRISKLGRRTRKIWTVLGCMSCGG